MPIIIVHKCDLTTTGGIAIENSVICPRQLHQQVLSVVAAKTHVTIRLDMLGRQDRTRHRACGVSAP